MTPCGRCDRLLTLGVACALCAALAMPERSHDPAALPFVALHPDLGAELAHQLAASQRAVAVGSNATTVVGRFTADAVIARPWE